MNYELKGTLVKINDVSLVFDEKVILSHVNAEVRDIVRPGCITGQIVGILGPSGRGKTQLSRILTGLQAPTSGTITVGDKTTPLEAGTVGYVPQNYPLFRHRTVLANLILAARRGGMDPKTAEARAMDYLQRFELADKKAVYPAQLSGGQRQRVAIAQQLLCSKHYLVLDEPTTGLDPIMKDRVCDFIQQVAAIAEENTIFVVSHDIPAICSIADTLWLLGYVRDEKGQPLGSSLRFSYDLIERGIAWHEKPTELPAFTDLTRDIRAQFEEL